MPEKSYLRNGTEMKAEPREKETISLKISKAESLSDLYFNVTAT
jgi:hypothetical protein